MSRLLGARLEDILGARSTDFYADASERAAVLTRLRRDGHLREMELRLRRPDGTVFWSLLSADPIEFDGEAALLSGIVDLSEHKRNEERLRDVMRALADRDFLLTSDLERARAFQDSLLPPALVRDDVTVEVLFRPVDEVSGDVYDIEIVDGSLLRLFVADATGHGVSAALTTMFLRSEYDVAAQGERSPAMVLRALNSRMLRFGERILMRFTAICLTVDLRTGVVTWATAAHPGPVVLRDGEVIELESGGTFVGLVEGAEFFEHTAQLQPGDTICAYSDGLTEALDRGGKPLGEARVHAALEAARGAGESLAAAALEAVTGGIGDAQDDVVLLAARWSPAGLR